MKKLLSALAILAVIIFWYVHSSSKRTQLDKQTALLQKEVDLLEAQNAALSQKTQKEGQVTQKDQTGQNQRLDDLRSKLDAENNKLLALQKRREMLTVAINDPSQANSVNDNQEEIREKTEAIQSLQLQLGNNQDYEKMVDHGGEAAKQYQGVAKAQSLADLNTQIRAQQTLIQNTQDAIRANRVLATADSMNQANALVAVVAQQKIDLENMRRAHDQINVAAATQSNQIHNQVGYEKTNIHSNEQEIRAQINQLTSEVKTLQAQNTGEMKTTHQIKQRAISVDQQISAEHAEIERIQGLIKTYSQ
jgi:hypothetical protein